MQEGVLEDYMDHISYHLVSLSLSIYYNAFTSSLQPVLHCHLTEREKRIYTVNAGATGDAWVA